MGGVTGLFYQTILEISFLPYKAYIAILAIIKTLYRIFISKQNLLEWMTAEEAEKQAVTTKIAFYKEMFINVLSGMWMLFFSMQGSFIQRILGFFLGILWIIGPNIACNISKPTPKENSIGKLSDDERNHLMEIAKKTWDYFSSFINEENNFLPQDNFEEARSKQIAKRTSPTNIGLGILSIISAIDFKFISYNSGINLLSKCISAVDGLVKWNGHLYNWYDLETLKPLNPAYISSVDSGNFVGYLYVLKQFLLENDKNEIIDSLIKIVDRLINNTDFSKLYDSKKKLFSIGFNVEENKLTDSYYDLLASEARQTSLIAIAKKDVPIKHWSALNRTLTVYKKYKGLVSWSGTAFEYFMPDVIVKNYPGSLLQESNRFVVLCQREYCKMLKIPWGISEAAFALKDLHGNYQYKAFGIPWLGLKRGLAYERVVSSYGSILTILNNPKEVMDNIKLLENEKMLGKYGLFESIDFTPSRLKIGTKSEVVKTYMAHHQGLILASINNFFHDGILINRFMKNPEIEAVDILLQERMPKVAILTKEKKERIEKIRLDDYETYSQRVYTKVNTTFNNINVISSDKYTVFLDDKGRGYSKYNDLLINKYKEDFGTEQGIFFYIKNIKTKKTWTNANIFELSKPDKYKIIFSPDSNTIFRTDGDIESKTKIAIAPEEPVEIRELLLKNAGTKETILEVSSILEPVLCSDAQEYSHPAFNSLFLTYEWMPNIESIIVKRKKRDQYEKDVYLGVSIYSSSSKINDTEFEIDKAELRGRENIGIPIKIEQSKPFSNKSKLVTEGAAAFRQTIKLNTNEQSKIALLITINDNKDEVISTLEKYRNIENIERAFELSRAKNELENRYLGINANETDLFQKMLGLLLKENPIKSIDLEKMPKEIYSQEDLWSLGVSGDIPILLVKIRHPNDSYIINDILKAKEFFNLKNCKIDIVILNEEKNIYEQYVKEKIENAIIEKHLAYLIGKKNGIYIINNSELNNKQRNSIILRSNLILDAGKGNLKRQIDELEECVIDREKQIGFENSGSPKESIVGDKISLNPSELKYYNEYGGFNLRGNEYVIKKEPNNNLPTVWSHIIANKSFGAIVTDNMGGFTWSLNSRLNKLTSWDNTPCLDIPSEILYIKEKNTGKVWSNSSFISGNEGDFKVVYGFGYANYTNLCNDFFMETEIFVPKEDNVKVNIIKMKNTSENKRNLKFVYYIKPVLGEDEYYTKGMLNLEQKSKHYMEMKNLGNGDFLGITFLRYKSRNYFLYRK